MAESSAGFCADRPLPMTPQEAAERGWDAVDVVFVTGDAYVDHPSFAMALLGRLLEAEGFRVAILSQPDWHSCHAWRSFGRPRICFAVSAGNMDSMLNRYTAERKVRNDDAYSPDARIGLRPERATIVYCQRAREAYHGVPIIAGGVEASLRRFAHYDYWSDKVRRSLILDAKADLLVYGMGERPLVEIVKRLAAGESPQQLRDIRGVVYRLGAREAGSLRESQERQSHEAALPGRFETAFLPSFEEVVRDKVAFATMTRIIYEESNPWNARRLVQFHDREAVAANPPAWPLSEWEMDRIYGLPFTRRPHPAYGRREIPAFTVVKSSIQIMRGCFGGCSFCAIGLHEGRIIQCRSQDSILQEVQHLAATPRFSGVISDLGGPTANMYGMNCARPEAQAKCRRTSCLWPAPCPALRTDHGRLIRLLKAVRHHPAIKQVFVASGVRMDLALRSPAYVRLLAKYHTGGLLKIAPEHCHEETLRRMCKPDIACFEEFSRLFYRYSQASGKRQYLEPYFLAGHPGSDLAATIELALYLKRHGMKPEKVQDFVPTPMTLATAMYYTGLDPLSGEPVYVPRGARERRLQKALLQYFKPENYADVLAALTEAGRLDLVGDGPDCLLAEKKTMSKEPVSRTARPAAKKQVSAVGYRPHRASAKRRSK